ncbi:MAG: ATP-grasp fold amidoligase family protein [Burkholderiaceae bacterium]
MHAALRGKLLDAFERARHARPHLTLARKLLTIASDRLYLSLGYRAYFGEWPDYDVPRTFNERIHAYMLTCRDPLLQLTADKVALRDYLEKRIGKDFLVPLIGVWNSPQEVPIEMLPCPSVLKASASSGMVLLLRSHRDLNANHILATLRRWQRRDYSRLHREWCYAGLQRKIIAEHMLLDASGEVPADYKAYVIGGKLRFIQVDRGRFSAHTRNLYSTDWQLLPVRLTLENHAQDTRPAPLSAMIEIAEELARPFEFLRVDFYVLGKRLFVGELTHYPGAGFERFMPHAFALELGKYWIEKPGNGK